MSLIRIASAFVIFSLISFGVSADDTASARLMRLNVEIGPDGVHLLDAEFYSGMIRPQRLAVEHRNDPIALRIMSKQGRVLFEETLQDPRIQYFDEPAFTGRLRGAMIRNRMGIVSVLLPLSPDAGRIEFYERDFNSQSSMRYRESLGSISIRHIQTLARQRVTTTAIDPVNIQRTGRPENRIDIVFLAEGFTSSQRAIFVAAVRRVVANWKTIFPWSQYFRLLNIYAVPLVSQQSGADHPSRAISRNTALDATYDCAGIGRLVCINTSKAFTAAADSVPMFDFAIAVVNDPEYGGSGGPVSVFSLHSDARQIFFHEFAHTYAKLADEYTAANPNPGPFNEKLYANVTRNRNRNTIKWRAWIEANTPIPTPDSMTDVIGLFQGAFFHPTRYYRPKADCLMRTLGAPFDSICAEAHILNAFQRVSFIDMTSPAGTTVVLRRGSQQTFRAKPAPLPLMRLQFEWLVDGVLQSSRGQNFTLQTGQLAPGTHRITVRVTDTTPFVRRDPQKLRTDSFTWIASLQ